VQAVDSVKILLIDDHALVRAGLRILIESQPGLAVVGEASQPADALALARERQPHVVLLDLDLGGQNGAEMIPDLLAACPTSRILVLTGVRDVEIHRRAVQLGAVGVVQKEMAAEVLVKAIEKVHAGEVWLDRALTASVLNEMSQAGRVRPVDPEQARNATLSRREREVIALIAEGLSNKRIAERLSITETTVRHHLTSIYTKLEVADRLELLVYSYRTKLARPPA
jgi:DNA-binding NarL/FixJ family response regulator